MIIIKPKQQGFTLVELLIVVAIVAILAAIAYPMYTEQVHKSKRSDAQIGLQQIMRLQEEYFLRNYSYASTLVKLGFTQDVVDSPSLEYDLTLSQVTPAGCTSNSTNPCSGYLAVAVPNTTAGQSQSQTNDSACQTFGLDQLGRKLAQDSAKLDTSSKCWR